MTVYQADVVIISGGIVGYAAAYYLAKRGASVTLPEKNGIGSGASGRSGGGVRQSARASVEMPLAHESVALFQTLSDELGVDAEYVRRGNLRLVESVDHLRPKRWPSRSSTGCTPTGNINCLTATRLPSGLLSREGQCDSRSPDPNFACEQVH